MSINKASMSFRQEKSRKLSSIDCSLAEQSSLQQDERVHAFLDTHGCASRSKTAPLAPPPLDPAPSGPHPHPRLIVFPDEQRSSVNESSSLLGGSPHRHCRRRSSPFHTGQLHPAVRVADLLQHINQMKTAEGYGFKQEYEVSGGQRRVM